MYCGVFKPLCNEEMAGNLCSTPFVDTVHFEAELSRQNRTFRRVCDFALLAPANQPSRNLKRFSVTCQPEKHVRGNTLLYEPFWPTRSGCLWSYALK